MADKKLIQLLNILGYVAMVVVNILANTLPLNGLTTQYLADQYPNLFVPAGFTFSIWGLIYLLLGGFVIYQGRDLFKRGTADMSYLEKMGYLFFGTTIFNIAWIFAWHYQQVVFSLAIMIALLLTLILIYNRLNIDARLDRGLENLVVRLPFSIYLGWITVATIANVTAVLVHLGWNRFGLSDVFWTVLVIAVAIAITLFFIFIRRDMAYSMVVLWAFLGIVFKRMNVEPVEMAVVAAASTGMIVIAASALIMGIQRSRDASAQ